MDQKPGNDPRSGDDLEETLARKRSRRVSFAETTAVHVFDRDEDFETPPTTDPKPSPPSTASCDDDRLLGFPGVGHGEDHSEDDDDEEEEERFVRDMDSSPGSAVGSVNSNDDGNFFGPVSTSFIRSGRLSESGMSDDNNHDITLDSTAFSLHFLDIARPDDCTDNSSRSLRITTEDSMPTDSPGFPVPKGFMQLESGSSDGKLSSTAGNTTNMSLIVESPDKFDDYGRMSPTLEALLAEANKRIHPYSPIGEIRGVTSKVCDEKVAFVKESGEKTPQGSICIIGNEVDGVTSKVLLAEANKRIHPYSPIGGIRGVTSKVCDEKVAFVKESGEKTPQGSICIIGNEVDGVCIETQLASSCSVDTASKLISYDIPSPRKAESPFIYASIDEKTQGPSSSNVNDSFRSVCGPIQSNIVAADARKVDVFTSTDRNPEIHLSLESGQIQEDLSLNKGGRSRHYTNSSPELRSRLPTLLSMDGQEQALLFEHGMHTPKDAVITLQSSLQGSISSLHSKRQQLFHHPAVLSQTRLMYTPEKEQPPSALKIELRRFGERISAIKNHISNSKVLKSSILIESRSTLSDKDPLPPELKVRRAMKMSNNDLNIKHTVGSHISKEDMLHVDQEASLSNELNHLEHRTAQTGSLLTHLEKNEVNDETVEMITGVTSFQFPQSDGNKQRQSTPEHPIEQVFTPDVHGSCLGEGTLHLRESSQAKYNLGNAIPSPVQMPGCKLSKSQEDYLFLKGDRKTRSSTFLEENNIPSNYSYIPSNISQEKMDSSRNCDSRNTEVTHSVSLKETLFPREMLSSNRHSLDDDCEESSSANKSRKFLSGDTAQSPNKNSCNNNMVYSSKLEKSVPSNLSKDCIPFDHDISYHGQQFLEDAITGKKRALEQIFQTSKDRVSEMSTSLKSQKVLPNVMGPGIFSSEHLHCSNGSHSSGEGPQGHWRDTISRVSEATRQLFSPAICKFSSQKLDIIEDALSVLQNGRKYDRLSASLRNHELPGVLKREAEARSLLDKLVYEKAMVHLKRIKLDQLSNKEQACKLQIQESDKLKSIYLHLCARTFQKSQFHSVSSNPPINNQEEHDRVKSMREELEMLRQKVEILMKSFETSCKINRDMNCDRVINVVKDHLETVNCYRAIQHDLQLWKVSDVVKKNDCCNIVLRYQDLLTQSFAINYSSASSMVVIDFLINTSIEKNFPNMNASAAFEFVFKAKGDGKLISLKHLQRETMETNLLFGTLLDVLEEILVSRMEMWNLVSSTFHSQCSGQLELRLCFLSFKSGVKVSLSLDMSGLNCAIYPSEPSELLIRISSEHTTLPTSISEEIRSRVGDLRSGRSAIFRLCQSISQMVSVSI